MLCSEYLDTVHRVQGQSSVLQRPSNHLPVADFARREPPRAHRVPSLTKCTKPTINSPRRAKQRQDENSKQLGQRVLTARQSSIGLDAKDPQGHGNEPKHTGKHTPAEAIKEFNPGCTKGTKLRHQNDHYLWVSTSLPPSVPCKQALLNQLSYCASGLALSTTRGARKPPR